MMVIDDIASVGRLQVCLESVSAPRERLFVGFPDLCPNL